MSDTPRPRRRNPEERRRTIVEAAAALILEVGSAGLTHRLVAHRAEVPLGSTTQYFATLDDLRDAALAHLAHDIDVGLAEVSDTLAEHGPVPAVFARALHDYISQDHLIRADMALISAAAVDPKLRPLAVRWSDGMVALLSPHVGARAARAVTAFADGVSMHALLNGTPMDVDDLTTALAALTEPGDDR